MAVRRALTLQQGQVRELGSTDGICIGVLPMADNTPPDVFMVRQSGDWRMATFAQMQYWLGGMVQPAALVTANLDGVTVNGTNVYVNWETEAGLPVRVNGALLLVNGAGVTS